METITLTKIFVTDKKKDGTPLEGKYGPYHRVAVKCNEYGDMYITGFMSRPPNWKEGDKIDVELTESEYKGERQIQFKLPKKEDLFVERSQYNLHLEQHQKLCDRVGALENEVFKDLKKELDEEPREEINPSQIPW